jgi:hypothetical protein
MSTVKRTRSPRKASPRRDTDLSSMKFNKSPRRIPNRKPNSWSVFVGYITNSIGAQTGEAAKIDEFMDIIRKNYPGKLPEKSKVKKGREHYREKAAEKLKILKEVDPDLVRRADDSIKEIISMTKRK